MSFLNPIAIWGPLALLGIAVPVIIHLLSRFRPKPMEWAAMELLRRALVVRARRIRLEDLLLLLLRALAMAAVAFALARPSITESTSQWIGNSKVGVLIAIDGSFSMAHQSGVTKSRFEHAVGRAREICSTLSAGDTVTLVLMGQRPRVLLRNVGFDEERTEATLKALEPLAEPMNVELCLDEIARLMDDLKAPAKECYLITDAQSTTWSNLSDAVGKSVQNLRNSGTVFFVPAGPQNAENIAVTRLVMASGVLRKGSIAHFNAEVRNFGRMEVRNLSVKLLVDDVETDKNLIDTINPGETRTLSFFAPFKQSGTFAVSAVLEGNDPLAIDNRRHLVVEVRDGVKVLCVDGSPSVERLGGETGILSLALTVKARKAAEPANRDAASGVSVRVIPVEDLRASDLSSYDIACLAGVAEVSHAQTVGLSDFVRRGGGLVVFLGRKTDRNLMNGMRDSDGTPLLPAELGEIIGDKPRAGEASSDLKGWSLSADQPDHPVTDLFSRMPREQWAGIRFWRYVKASPREDTRVLLRLAPSNDPILMERRMGRGKVYLFTSSANRDWNDMIVNPAYLMLVQQLVTDLTRKPYETPVTVGDKITFEVASDDSSRDLTVRDPRGDDISLRIVEKAGIKTAILEDADLPGVYTARSANRIAATATATERPAEQRIAVNVDTRESDVAVLRDTELNSVVNPLSMRLINEKQAIRSTVTESRQGRELWRILLMAALAILIIEAILARLFTRRLKGTTEVYTRRTAEI